MRRGAAPVTVVPCVGDVIVTAGLVVSGGASTKGRSYVRLSIIIAGAPPKYVTGTKGWLHVASVSSACVMRVRESAISRLVSIRVGRDPRHGLAAWTMGAADEGSRS